MADMTWLGGFDDGCERRRRPAPSLNGAELLDGRYSEGTSSPGRRINGDAILRSKSTGRVFAVVCLCFEEI